MGRSDDAALVDAFLRSLAEAADCDAPPLDADALVRRAQLRAQLEAERRRADGVALPLLAAALLAPMLAVAAAWAVPVPSGVIAASVALVTAAAGTFAVWLALIEE